MAVFWGAFGIVDLASHGPSWGAAIKLLYAIAVAAVLVFQVLRPRPPRKITDAQVRQTLQRSGGHLPDKDGQPDADATRS